MKVKIGTARSVVTGGLWLILGIWWCAACSTPNTLPVEAPFVRNSKTIGLSVKVNTYNYDTNTRSYEFWRVDLEKHPFETQRMLTSTTELELVDCRPFEVQCVALASDVGRVSQLRRWQVTPTTWEEITATAITTSSMSILASSTNGTWLRSCTPDKDTCGLYFQTHGQSAAAALTNYPSTYCNDQIQLSPTGEYAALQCWDDELMKKSANYLSPIGQHLRLIKADGSHEYLLTLPTTYFFYGAYLCCRQPFWPQPPSLSWSPDGTEIAFVAAFAPPLPLTTHDTPQPNTTSPYQLFGGIYSISLDDKSIHEWTKVGGEDAPLTWSPDGKQIAYAVGEGTPVSKYTMYVVSRDGSQRQIGSIDAIKSLLWSPDGAYIAVQGIDRTKSNQLELWVVSLTDYTWHHLNLQGEVIDMRWVTLEQP